LCGASNPGFLVVNKEVTPSSLFTGILGHHPFSDSGSQAISYGEKEGGDTIQLSTKVFADEPYAENSRNRAFEVLNATQHLFHECLHWIGCTIRNGKKAPAEHSEHYRDPGFDRPNDKVSPWFRWWFDFLARNVGNQLGLSPEDIEDFKQGRVRLR